MSATIAAAAAAIAAAFYVAAILAFVALHLKNRTLSIATSAVSEYAIGQSARLFTIYGIIGSLGAIALAVATYLRGDFPARVPLYLALLVLIRFGVLVFRTDKGGKADTAEGRIHLLFAIATFALTYMALAAAGPDAERLAPSALAQCLQVLSWIAAASLAAVVVTLAPPLRNFFGLAERAFLSSSLIWFLLFAIALAIRN